MIWNWTAFLRTPERGEGSAEQIMDPDIWEAVHNCVLHESEQKQRRQAWRLLEAGWRFEMPEHEYLDIMSWSWRAPPKRKGRAGRKYLSTNQAYNAMVKSYERVPLTDSAF